MDIKDNVSFEREDKSIEDCKFTFEKSTYCFECCQQRYTVCTFLDDKLWTATKKRA